MEQAGTMGSTRTLLEPRTHLAPLIRHIARVHAQVGQRGQQLHMCVWVWVWVCVGVCVCGSVCVCVWGVCVCEWEWQRMCELM